MKRNPSLTDLTFTAAGATAKVPSRTTPGVYYRPFIDVHGRVSCSCVGTDAILHPCPGLSSKRAKYGDRVAADLPDTTCWHITALAKAVKRKAVTA